MSTFIDYTNLKIKILTEDLDINTLKEYVKCIYNLNNIPSDLQTKKEILDYAVNNGIENNYKFDAFKSECYSDSDRY